MDRSVEKPDLRQVTLVAVTSVALTATVAALEESLRQANFGRALLLSDRPPVLTNPVIEWRPIHPLNSRGEYSRFMIRELAGHIGTSHALCVQWDGFVLDGGRWDPGFLEFDYIGAVWPHFQDNHKVGNGGFSLRSRRLMDQCESLPLDGPQAEDVLIGRIHRHELERRGIRFAPEDVARRFSYERAPSVGNEFGFHGAFNLAKHLPGTELIQILRGIEPEVLASAEQWEMLRWAVSHGRPRMARVLIDRIVRRAKRRSGL